MSEAFKKPKKASREGKRLPAGMDSFFPMSLSGLLLWCWSILSVCVCMVSNCAHLPASSPPLVQHQAKARAEPGSVRRILPLPHSRASGSTAGKPPATAWVFLTLCCAKPAGGNQPHITISALKVIIIRRGWGPLIELFSPLLMSSDFALMQVWHPIICAQVRCSWLLWRS